MLCESEAQFWCDEGPFGKGTGGQLRYELEVPAGGERTLWIAVAGSDKGAAGARSQLTAALADPAAALASKRPRASAGRRTRSSRCPPTSASRRASTGASRTCSTSPSAPTTSRSATSTRARTIRPPLGTVAHVGFIGAGYPDYPWMFATDAEYTAFASVAAGQFEAIKEHAVALRDMSVILNGDSGKVLHEVVADGSVYFGNLRARRQHRRDGEVPEPRRADLALDRRRGVPARPISVRRAQHALHHDAARRGRRRLARGSRQRRARGHGRREARQRRLHDPRALRPRRHGARRARRRDVRVGAGEGARAPRALRGRLVVRPGRSVRRLARSTPTTSSPSRSTGSASRRWRPS